MSANGDTSKQNSTLEPATLPDAGAEQAAGLRPGVEQPVPADVVVTDASDKPAPVGESEVILLPMTYKKGQVLQAASGREYKVIEVNSDFIRLRHEAGEINVRREDIPGLLAVGAKGESVKQLSAEQFAYNSDLYSVAYRLQSAGLLVDVAEIRLSTQIKNGVVLRITSNEGYALVLNAMPKHLRVFETIENEGSEVHLITVRESLYDDHDIHYENALDLLDSTDDPLIAALQTQLAEAIADNNRLRSENAELRALADEQEGRAQDYRALLHEADEADAALDETGYPIVSKTEVALDIEQRTADAIIERYKAEGWWKEESAFVWRVDPKHPNGGSIAHVIRFEREATHKAGRSLVREAAVAVGSQPTEPVFAAVMLEA